MDIKAFVDSDVFISSLISKTGAANFLINEANIKLFVSNVSIEEIVEVVKRLGIKDSNVKDIIKKYFSKVMLQDSIPEIKTKYRKYVTDVDDAHIVAGAAKGNVRFLISYNIKDFDIEKIKEDFEILVMRPAQFLQYLRSIK